MGADPKLFNMENVHTTWLITALCIAPIALYGVFRMLSARVHGFTELSIAEVSERKARKLFGRSFHLDCNDANA